MPKSSPIQTNFNGGEISLLSQGRVDLPVYKKSLAKCYNWIPTIQGGVTRRPGTLLAGNTKNNARIRLIPFVISTTQAFMLEFGANYIRVWNSDGTYTGTELVTTYAQNDLRMIKFVQHNQPTGNFLYLAHSTYPPAFVKYFSAAWSYSAISFFDGPYQTVDMSGNVFNVVNFLPTLYNLTASNTNGINNGSGFQASDVGRYVRIYQKITTNVANATSVTTIADGQPGWLSASNRIAKGLQQLQIAPAAGVGAITKEQVGFAKITGYVSSTAVVLTTTSLSPDFVSGGTIDFLQFGLFCDFNGYPSCVAVHQDRLFFAGVPGQGKRLDGSVTENFTAFSPSNVQTLQADDNMAVSYSLLSEDANNILWMKSAEQGLLCGTEGDEWTVSPSAQNGALTPTSVSARSSTFYGSGNVDAVKVGKNVVFVQRYGKKVREMVYDFYLNGYRAPDRTFFAPHIAGSSGIVEMAYQKGPNSIVWCVRGDGLVAGMTHEEEDGQIATGWHEHQFGGDINHPGFAESVAVIPSADATYDAAWFEVKRKINNAFVRTIEMMQPLTNDFDPDPVLGVVFLDCAKLMQASGATFAAGSNFNGATVGILQDGKPQVPVKANNAGLVTFKYPTVTGAVVGFSYNSDLQLLRFESGSADGGALGKIRRTHRVDVLYFRSLCIQLGMSFTQLTELFFRDSTALNDNPTPPFSGVRVDEIDANPDFDNQICFRVAAPVSATILAVQPRMDTQDAE